MKCVILALKKWSCKTFSGQENDPKDATIYTFQFHDPTPFPYPYPVLPTLLLTPLPCAWLPVDHALPHRHPAKVQLEKGVDSTLKIQGGGSLEKMKHAVHYSLISFPLDR